MSELLSTIAVAVSLTAAAYAWYAGTQARAYSKRMIEDSSMAFRRRHQELLDEISELKKGQR